MKKSTQIIIGHLIAQLVIGAIVIVGADEKFAGETLGFLGVAFTYIFAGSMTIIASTLAIYYFHKQARKVVLRALLFSLCLWIFGPFCINPISQLIPEESNSEHYERTTIKPTIKTVKELGFRKYIWDDYRAACLVRLPDGRQHYLLMNGDYLNIYAKIKEPAMNDTLNWMRTALLEALVYLKPKYISLLNSDIIHKNYHFELINNKLTVTLKLGSTNPDDPPENWIEAESIGKDPNRNKLGNIRIGFFYRDQVLKW